MDPFQMSELGPSTQNATMSTGSHSHPAQDDPSFDSYLGTLDSNTLNPQVDPESKFSLPLTLGDDSPAAPFDRHGHKENLAPVCTNKQGIPDSDVCIRLERAWRNERLAPVLLPCPESEIEEIKQLIDNQV